MTEDAELAERLRESLGRPTPKGPRMQLTKYTHATVTLTDGETTIVIDPGQFTPESRELATAATAVLVTHEHGDHFDPDAIGAALDANPALRVWAPAPVAAALGDHDGRVTAVSAGDTFTIGAIPVAVFGEQHAVIHPDMPAMANVGYLVDGRVFHPGDAYLVPGVPVETLLMPTSGPWANIRGGVDYIREVAPAQAYQIHELLLSEPGQQNALTLLGADGLGGVPIAALASGETVEV